MKPSPQWKLVSEETLLNNRDSFWDQIEATHVAFKNGRSSDHLLLNEDLSPDDMDNYKSTNKRHFFRKRGNAYTLPEFRHSGSGSGYQYGLIHWSWRCRTCYNQIPRKSLDSKEVCPRCSDKSKEKPTIPF